MHGNVNGVKFTFFKAQTYHEPI